MPETTDNIGLDYIEPTGPHVRVGLFATDYREFVPEDEERLTEVAEYLTGLTKPWDVRIHGYRVELSYERDD